ncbi:MAG: histidine kinase dimerization/phospho-acceptor domain-containing protein, partial [Anaerolineae bacterium]
MPTDLTGGYDPNFSLPQRPDGYVILAIYAVLALAALIAQRRTFRGLGLRRWAVFVFLLIASVPLNGVLVLALPGVMSAAGVPETVRAPSAPLLGLLCVLLAGAWVGTGPAILVGLAGGAARMLLAEGRITHPAELALFAWLAAWLMQQNYRGWLSRALRRPFIASLIASLLGWALALPAIYAAAPGSELAAFDYTLSLFFFAGLPVLVEGALNGFLTHLACLAFPALRPPLTGTQTPFYARSLNRRLLLTILPITFATITAQVVFVGATALGVARQQAVDQLVRNARAAVVQLSPFLVDGQAVLEQFAADDRLRDASADVRQARLTAAMRTVAFFDELLLVDVNGRIVNRERVDISESPDLLATSGDPELTGDESALLARVLESGAPQQTGVHRDADGLSLISFVQPIRAESGLYGVLIGRARLVVNPLINKVKRNLTDPAEPDDGGPIDANNRIISDQGRFTSKLQSVGYLIDENNRIIVHPNPDLEFSQWIFNPIGPAYLSTDRGGEAYISLSDDNVRRLTSVQEVSGMPWKVAIELPYSSILSTAAQISMPLLVMFGVIMLGALILLPFISRRITRPLGALAQAAGRIARGELGRPVPDIGEDEVGQLGAAFEGMRQSLKARMDDLRLLLRVSEDVAASLDLDRGIPPILDAAMQISAQHMRSEPARAARLIVFDEAGQPARVLARGDGPLNVTPLDAELARVTPRDERPLLIANVARSHGAIDPNLVGPGVRSIAALPLRRQNRVLGILWLGYADPRPFDESETALLATLAGQAAVFIENARLFEAAEGGRQRLQAVLSSTNDAVLVTDRDNHILLCNPAAEIAFGLSRGEAIGRMVDEAISHPVVIDLLAETGETATRTAEVPLPDGRTLYASASTIVAGDGQRIGRVAVLRDITHLKELDTLKSEFVATVSHDLRAPLTYMRGYATMVSMVGQVQPKQKDYLDKIMGGVEQMTALIDDLLDLGRIEAGVGILRDTVSLAHV